MKYKSRKTGGAAAVACSALLGIMFCLFISNSCEHECRGALLPEITASQQRIECVHILRLNGWVGIIRKIFFANPHPRAMPVNMEHHSIATHQSILGGTEAKNLSLLTAQSGQSLVCFALVSGGLIFQPLVPLNLSALGECVDNKPANNRDNISKDGKTERDINWPSWVWWIGWRWYHWLVFFWMCFFNGAGMCAIWQLMMPNVQAQPPPLSVTPKCNPDNQIS
jgi:hypothetical protein